MLIAYAPRTTEPSEVHLENVSGPTANQLLEEEIVDSYRILCLTKYEEGGASSRYRTLQYLPLLEEHSLSFRVAPLLSNEYLKRLYASKRANTRYVMTRYFGRIRQLVQSGEFDLVWIEKEALPYVPGWLERLLLTRKTPYILDYDDAVFHNIDNLSSPLLRSLLHKKHDWVMRGAEVVVAGNPYIAEYAERAGARCIEVIPSVVDLRRYAPRTTVDQLPVQVGWIGTPVTSKFLDIVRDVVASQNPEEELQFTFIGSGDLKWGLPNVSYLEWSPSSEVHDLRNLSIGIMPLVDSPFERGKCGLKLIQYMAVGIPVIASPVGVNTQIVEPGINGFLAQTSDDWHSAIHQLASNPEMRSDFGKAGRKKVEEHYSLEGTAPRLAEVLIKAARKQYSSAL